MADRVAVYLLPSATFVPSGSPCSIGLTGFTNTSVGGSYTSIITTYDNSGTPAAIDNATTGTLVFADASNTTSVSATIDPVMMFGVFGGTSVCRGTTPTGTSTSTSASLGHVNSSAAVSATQNLSVTDNAGNAVALYVRTTGPLSDGNGHTISDLSGDGTWQNAASFPATGTAGFGYTYGWQSAGVYERFLTTNLANISFPIVGGASCILYQAQTAPTTAAGSYSTTVIYTAVPSF